MKVHANILDTILNTSTHASNFGSPDLGDAFLDTGGRARGGQTSARTASVLRNDDVLAEAFSQVSAKQAKVAASRESVRLRSVKDAVEFAASLERKIGGQSAKTAALDKKGEIAQAAGRRLASLMEKTPAQMRQDGASKLADYFDPAVVPAWAKQANADFALLQRVRLSMAPVAKSASADVVQEKSISDTEIKGYVDKLLNEGNLPKVIQEKLNKLADLQLFDKSLASQYLNDRSGLLGYAYIEPNHYMGDCAKSARQLASRRDGGKVGSVKQIAACEGCQHLKKHAGQKSCGIYGLPVVANGKELLPIINNLTGGAKDKKAALVRLANREEMKVETKTASSQFARTGAKGRVLVNGGGTIDKTAAPEFTAKTVLTMHNSGQSLNKIYAHGSKTAGVTKTKKAVREFVAGLKGTQTKVALTQIDCTLLPGKLASSNAIIGESKCASCTYRKGAHCGLTGGTLVSFPGMEKGMGSRTASSKDGLAMVKEFGLTDVQKPSDIELTKPTNNDVELSSQSRVDL